MTSGGGVSGLISFAVYSWNRIYVHQAFVYHVSGDT